MWRWRRRVKARERGAVVANVTKAIRSTSTRCWSRCIPTRESARRRWRLWTHSWTTYSSALPASRRVCRTTTRRTRSAAERFRQPSAFSFQVTFPPFPTSYSPTPGTFTYSFITILFNAHIVIIYYLQRWVTDKWHSQENVIYTVILSVKKNSWPRQEKMSKNKRHTLFK